MRKLILSTALLGAVGLSFATNGDNLIGLTPASRGMGGIGVGMPVGSVDSIFRNPAWISFSKEKFSLQFGGILFMPEVKARTNVTPMGPMNPPAEATSDAKVFVVPEVGVVHKVNNKLAFGIGAFGVSGMGVDYRNKDQRLANMHTNFQFMRVIPTLAYKVNDALAISGALHLAYGSLDMGARMCDNNIPPNCWNAGGGQSQTYGLGFQLGVAYNMGDFVFAGLTYQSPVSMTYKRVFDSNNNNEFEDLKLTQPQELAFGVGVKPMQNFKVGMDLRWINWENAKGYKEFQWKDQWVIGIGGEYKPIPKLALRAGWNYGESPIKGGAKNLMNANSIPDFVQPFSDFRIAYFNLVGFPAITEHHITLGMGYEFTPNFGVEASYVHAFNKKVSATDNANMGFSVEAQNAQNSFSIGLNWKF